MQQFSMEGNGGGGSFRPFVSFFFGGGNKYHLQVPCYILQLVGGSLFGSWLSDWWLYQTTFGGFLDDSQLSVSGLTIKMFQFVESIQTVYVFQSTLHVPGIFGVNELVPSFGNPDFWPKKTTFGTNNTNRTMRFGESHGFHLSQPQRRDAPSSH